MQLKTKLILISIFIALATLSLFSAVSYTSYKNLSTVNQLTLLSDFNEYFVSTLVITGIGPKLNSTNINGVTDHNSLNYYIAIFDSTNQIISDLGNTDIKKKIVNTLPLSVIGQKRTGSIDFHDETLLWVTTPIRDTSYTLLHSQRALTTKLSDYFDSVSAALLLITIIIVWIGVWTATSIYNLIEKVNEQKAVLSHKALHDDLTKLPNRESLIESIKTVFNQKYPKKKSFALCVIDLNHFKEINDSLGHHCGDELLMQVGTRLKTIVKSAKCIARLGGDEFAILFSHGKPSSGSQTAEKLIHALEPAFDLEGHSIYVGCTVGIAYYPQHATDARTLAQRAEMAMYQAKSVNKQFAIYDPDEDKSSIERLALINELRTAIDDEELQLYYQPKLDIQTNTIIGVEALARWNHPERGFIPPDQFIIAAEKTGLIKPLTHWVFYTAINQCAAWRKRGIYLRMSVNLSAWSLHDSKLEIDIKKMLTEANLPPSCLVLEITETAMMADPHQAKEILNNLDIMGIRIAIDDFGTGHSSLAYLKSLPVDEIKIDKSFVKNMIRDENDASIVRATISLAHDMGLKVVAEGVEEQAAQDRLKADGCDIIQGQHICRPLPAHELDRMLSPSKPTIVSSHAKPIPDDYSVIINLRENKS